MTNEVPDALRKLAKSLRKADEAQHRADTAKLAYVLLTLSRHKETTNDE